MMLFITIYLIVELWFSAKVRGQFYSIPVIDWGFHKVETRDYILMICALIPYLNIALFVIIFGLRIDTTFKQRAHFKRWSQVFMVPFYQKAVK